jgi:hypothetical protein
MKYLSHLLPVLAFLYGGTGAYLSVGAAEDLQNIHMLPVSTGPTGGESRSDTLDRLTILPPDRTIDRPALTTQTNSKTQLIGHPVSSRARGWPASATAAERGIGATRSMR